MIHLLPFRAINNNSLKAYTYTERATPNPLLGNRTLLLENPPVFCIRLNLQAMLETETVLTRP